MVSNGVGHVNIGRLALAVRWPLVVGSWIFLPADARHIRSDTVILEYSAILKAHSLIEADAPEAVGC